MSRELFESVSTYMRSHSDYITSTLARLVKIPSVRSAPAPGAPYGKKCAEALEETRKIYEENGFATEIHQGSGYLSRALRWEGETDRYLRPRRRRSGL